MLLVMDRYKQAKLVKEFDIITVYGDVPEGFPNSWLIPRNTPQLYFSEMSPENDKLPEKHKVFLELCPVFILAAPNDAMLAIVDVLKNSSKLTGFDYDEQWGWLSLRKDIELSVMRSMVESLEKHKDFLKTMKEALEAEKFDSQELLDLLEPPEDRPKWDNLN